MVQGPSGKCHSGLLCDPTPLKAGHMTEQTPHTPNGAIVVGIDDDEHSDLILSTAIDFARHEHRPLHLAHAYDPTPWALSPVAMYPPPPHLADRFRQSAKAVLDRGRAAVTEHAPDIEVTCQLSPLDAREALLSASKDAAMVVVGSRGGGRMTGLRIGSVSQWVSQHAPCPVVVARQSPVDVGRVVVGTDDSAASSAAVDFAFAQASLRRLPLTVVHCVDPVFRGGYGVFDIIDEDLDDLPGERRALAESVAGMREKYVDVDVTVELARGPAANHLSALSEQASMVVVGSHRRTAAGRLVHGAVSRAVVEHAHCTVAVVAAEAGAREKV